MPQINLKAVRTNAGMTIAEWADQLDVAIPTVCNWEAGKSEPSLSQCQKMSRLSNIPIDCFFVPDKSKKNG